MSCYQHLTIEERENILRYLSQGKGIREIGRLMNRAASSISREVKRNGGAAYSAHQAHKRYQERKRNSARQPMLLGNPGLRNTVRWMMAKLWCSPEQIANRLALEDNAHISTSTIYRALSNHSLHTSLRFHLRRSKAIGKRKGPGKGGDNKKYSRSIHQRPVAANNRSERGHLEGDTVHLLGRKEVIITLVDRCTRMLYTALSPAKDAISVQKAMKHLLKRLPPEDRKSLTLDRGSEFALLPDLEAQLGFTCYFCDPMSPRQRATNENFNGLLRQFYPKHTSTFSISQLSSFTALLNLRPRKCLAWLSPFEIHSGFVLHFS